MLEPLASVVVIIVVVVLIIIVVVVIVVVVIVVVLIIIVIVLIIIVVRFVLLVFLVVIIIRLVVVFVVIRFIVIAVVSRRFVPVGFVVGRLVAVGPVVGFVPVVLELVPVDFFRLVVAVTASLVLEVVVFVILGLVVRIGGVDHLGGIVLEPRQVLGLRVRLGARGVAADSEPEGNAGDRHPEDDEDGDRRDEQRADGSPVRLPVVPARSRHRTRRTHPDRYC